MELNQETAIQIAYALGIGLLVGLERAFEDDDAADAKHDAKEAADAKLEADKLAAAEDASSSEASGGDEAEGGEADETKDGEADETKDGEAPDKRDGLRDVAEDLGVRTFTVLSLFGFISAFASDQLPYVAPIGLAAVTLIVVAMYFRATHRGVGITTEVAAISTCGLGMLCHHHPHIAGVLALVLTVMLASKRFTHSTVRKMRRVELNDTLKFLAVILILLPLLPNRALDPYGAFNPYKVGMLVVLISGIGFVGYFLTRILGAQRGLGITGVIGGLTSSTAVTAAMAAQAKGREELRAICAFSTIAANATMFGRVLVVVAVLDIPLALRLAWPIGSMLAAALVASVILWFVAGKAQSKSGASAKVDLKNPFSVGPALKFAAFFVFILFLLKLAKTYLGDQGLYAAAALSGLADVDAITLSISEQARDGEMVRTVGAIAITIAVVSNSITKTGIAIYTGGWGFGRLVGACLIGATAVGLVVAVLV